MKVKTRRGPGLTGSQKNYGLVTGSIWNYEDKPTSNNVGTTLSPVPRDEATIEAERGETVIGDLDNDGMVEHAKIGGKRHSHGGTPLNVPDGSFVFSDYRGLLIKNGDVLKNIFGMSSGKAVTPAKVAQRYEINKFKNMLNDPFIDPIDRKTAQLMIDNNMRKLGQLALIQEGMKGFPDGIPAIAMPLMGSDMGQQGPQQQMMKKGGVVKYKKGGLSRYQGTEQSEVQGEDPQVPMRTLPPSKNPEVFTPNPNSLNYIGTDPDVGPLYEHKSDKSRWFIDPEGNWSILARDVEVKPPTYQDYNFDGVIDDEDLAIQNSSAASIAMQGDPSYDPMNQDIVYQTPEYKVEGTPSYYLNNALDIVQHPGSYLGYLMTPGEKRRFGAYLKDNTNPINDVLDLYAAGETGLYPFFGAMGAQMGMQDRQNSEAIGRPSTVQSFINEVSGDNEPVLSNEYLRKKLSEQGYDVSDIGVKNKTGLTLNAKPQVNEAGFGDIASTIFGWNQPSKFFMGQDWAEEHPGISGAIDTPFNIAKYALMARGLNRSLARGRGYKINGENLPFEYTAGKPYYNMGIFKNKKGLFNAGRPYLERQLAARQAGKFSLFPGINITDKVLQKYPGLYESATVDGSIPGLTSAIDEFGSGFNLPGEFAQRTGRTKLLYGVGDDALVNASSKLRPQVTAGKGFFENPELYNMPYKDYWTAKNLFKRGFQKYKYPLAWTGAIAGTSGLGAGLYSYNSKDVIPNKEINKQQKKQTTTLTGATDYQKNKMNDWLKSQGIDLNKFDKLSDADKEKWYVAYKKATIPASDSAFFTFDNSADDVAVDNTNGTTTSIVEKKKKEENTDENKKEEEKKETKAVKVKLPEKKKEYEDLGSSNKDTSGTYLRIHSAKKKKLGGALDRYDGVNKSQVYTGANTTIDRPESAIPADWSGLSSYDILYAPEGQTGSLPGQAYDETLGYYTATRDGKVQKIDLSDFYNRQSNILGNYDGGIEGWKTGALSRDEATRKKAVGWFQREYDKWRESIGLPKYFFGQQGSNAYGYDDLLGQYTSAAPGIVLKPRKEEKKVEEKKEDPKQEDPNIPAPNWQKAQRRRLPDPRYADILGEIGSTLQQIKRYPSVYAPVGNAPMETIYERFNPQTLMGAYTTALQNAGTGPDSGRAVDNIAGKVMEGVAQGQQQVEEQINNPRFMNMLAQNQQAKLRADAYNAAENVRYVDDVASKWQDYLANYNKKLANISEKAATTAENRYKLGLLQAMYPYANLNFDEFTTANPTLASITDDPMTSTTSGTFNSRVQELTKYYKDEMNYSKTEAAKAALEHAKAELAYNKMYSGTATSPFSV